MFIRIINAVVLSALLLTAAVARQPDAFDACAQEQDPAARLSCFDRETAARHARSPAPAPATTTKATPASTATATPAATSTADRDIGLDARQRRKERRERGEPEPPPPAPIVARVVRVIPRQPYISAFELDNGQIWEQSEAMNFPAKPQEEVTIRPGVLGAFFLKGADGSVVRAHRVK